MCGYSAIYVAYKMNIFTANEDKSIFAYDFTLFILLLVYTSYSECTMHNI